MALLTYTTYEEVRATLGVSSTELSDKVLSQPLYGTFAQLALEDIALDLPRLFDTIMLATTPTDAQARLAALIQLFVPYTLAKKLLSSLPLFAVQALTDGRAGFDRQRDANIYDNVREDVELVLADVTARLKAAYLTVTGVSLVEKVMTIPTLAVASLRGVDPVTNV